MIDLESKDKNGTELLKFIWNLPDPKTEDLSKNAEKSEALYRRHDGNNAS